MLLDASGKAYPDEALRPASPAAFSPYFATQESSARGFLWTFTPDTRKQLTPWARHTLLVKSRTLVENYGPAMALRSLARLIGALKPQSVCADTKWAALAEQRFEEITGTPLIFDAAGRFTFATHQVFTTYRRFVDGDIFDILTETSEHAARVATREAHQVVSPGTDNPAWNDGVRTDPNGFPLAYGFKTSADAVRVLPGLSVHHHASFSNRGATRGTPALAHFINHAHDMIETTGFQKQAIKTAALMGLTRRQDASTGGMPPALTGITGGVQSSPFQQLGTPAPAAAAASAPRVSYEDVLGGGIISTVPIDTLHDDRPHPNVQAFKEDLLRECAVGLGVPPAIMFFLGDKGGANARVDLDVFAKFVLDQHANHLLPFCQRFWVYAISKEMKEGRLPYPSKGDFWKVRWTPPRSLTADLGKMGALLIQLRKSLLTTYAHHYEEMGLNYEDELEQAAKEAAYLIRLEAKYKLPPGTMTAALYQSNAPAPPPPEEKKKEEDPPPEDPPADS